MDKVLGFVVFVHVLQHLVEGNGLSAGNVHAAHKSKLALVLVGLDGFSRRLNLTPPLGVLAEDRDPGEHLQHVTQRNITIDCFDPILHSFIVSVFLTLSAKSDLIFPRGFLQVGHILPHLGWQSLQSM